MHSLAGTMQGLGASTASLWVLLLQCTGREPLSLSGGNNRLWAPNEQAVCSGVENHSCVVPDLWDLGSQQFVELLKRIQQVGIAQMQHSALLCSSEMQCEKVFAGLLRVSCGSCSMTLGVTQGLCPVFVLLLNNSFNRPWVGGGDAGGSAGGSAGGNAGGSAGGNGLCSR